MPASIMNSLAPEGCAKEPKKGEFKRQHLANANRSRIREPKGRVSVALKWDSFQYDSLMYLHITECYTKPTDWIYPISPTETDLPGEPHKWCDPCGTCPAVLAANRWWPMVASKSKAIHVPCHPAAVPAGWLHSQLDGRVGLSRIWPDFAALNS